MAAAVIYGVLVNVVLLAASALGPPALGLFWLAIFCQFAVGAALVWRRTGLALMTAGFAAVAAVSAVFAVSSVIGPGWQALVARHPFLAVLGVACIAFLFIAERWAHPDVWRSLRGHGERATLLDVITFRHIPDLRHGLDL
jgi:hypothetical protein